MHLELTDDQEFLRETTAKFLANSLPPGVVRELRNDPAGYREDYWQGGAALGWTSLLVDEEHGGGSVSGSGIADLALIAHEFGVRAAAGPFHPSNIVAAALNDAGDEARFGEVLKGLLNGSSVASWCHAEPRRGGQRPELLEVEARVDGDEIVVNGTKRPVESAAQADHFLVTARTGTGFTQVLVPAGAPGIGLTALHSVDLTRRFWSVEFDHVRVPLDAVLGEVGGAVGAVDRLVSLELALLNAEAVGSMQAAFDMTVEWAFDRYSFGRPLASYQALKHRFADMKMWLEAAHAVTDAQVDAVGARSPDAAEFASAAKAYVSRYGPELVQDCVHLHGGIGVTFEHDIHLVLRRVTLNSALLGTAAEHLQILTDIAERKERRS